MNRLASLPLWELVLGQITVFLTVGLLAGCLWRKRPARAHRLLLLFLAAALGMPALSSVSGALGWGWLPPAERSTGEQHNVQHPAADSASPIPVEPPMRGPGSARDEDRRSDTTAAVIAPEADSPRGRSTVVEKPGFSKKPGFFAPLLLGGWIVLSSLCLTRLIASALAGRRLLRYSEVSDNPALNEAVAQAAGLLKLRVQPELRHSVEIGSPLIWCWGRHPVLLLPRSFVSVDRKHSVGVFCHELAHWKRRDHWANLLAQGTLIILPWHPLVWWVRSRLRILGEWACDDWALTVVRAPADYAAALLNLSPQRQSTFALAAVSRRRALVQRIRRILSHGASPPGVGRRWTVTASLLTTVLMALTALAQPAQRTNNTSETEPKTVRVAANPSSVDPTDRRLTGPKVTAFGKVVDAEGKPVSGVTVYLREWSTYRVSENPYDLHPEDVFATATTDRQGRFRFEEVASPSFEMFESSRSRWDVLAAAEGYALAWAHLPQAQNDFELTLTLQPEATLTGRVVDSEKDPIVGADVRVHEIEPLGSRVRSGHDDPGRLDLQRSQLAPATTTDNRGRFTIPGLPADVRLTLLVEHDEYVREAVYAATTDQPQPELEDRRIAPDGSRTVVRHPVHTGDFTVTMQPGYRITGRVVSADTGRSVPQARVSAQWGRRWRYLAADENGQFAFTGLPQAEFTVTARPPENSPDLQSKVNVKFGPNQRTAEVDVRLPRGVNLSGTVVGKDGDRPVKDVQVTYSGTDSAGNEFGSSTATDANGRFNLTVPPGRGTVTIYGPVANYYIPDRYVLEGNRRHLREEMPAQYRKTVEISPDRVPKEVRFTVGRGLVIRGDVVDSDGQPVAGADVVRPDDPFKDHEERFTRTNDEGRFMLAGFPPSREQKIVVTHSERHLVGTILAEPQRDDSEVTVHIPLQPAARVEGRVLLEEEPLPGATAYLTKRQERDGRTISRVMAHNMTDKEGKYAFDLIEPGAGYQISIRRRNEDSQYSRRFDLEPGETIRLKEMSFRRLESFVSGMVVDPDGNPVEGAVVTVQHRRTRQELSAVQLRLRRQATTTGDDGRFTIKHLPDVPLRVMAYIRPTGDDRRIRFPAYADAEPNQTDVRIVLDPKLVRDE